MYVLFWHFTIFRLTLLLLLFTSVQINCYCGQKLQVRNIIQEYIFSVSANNILQHLIWVSRRSFSRKPESGLSPSQAREGTLEVTLRPQWRGPVMIWTGNSIILWFRLTVNRCASRKRQSMRMANFHTTPLTWGLFPQVGMIWIRASTWFPSVGISSELHIKSN